MDTKRNRRTAATLVGLAVVLAVGCSSGSRRGHASGQVSPTGQVTTTGQVGISGQVSTTGPVGANGAVGAGGTVVPGDHYKFT